MAKGGRLQGGVFARINDPAEAIEHKDEFGAE